MSHNNNYNNSNNNSDDTNDDNYYYETLFLRSLFQFMFRIYFIFSTKISTIIIQLLLNHILYFRT